MPRSPSTTPATKSLILGTFSLDGPKVSESNLFYSSLRFDHKNSPAFHSSLVDDQPIAYHFPFFPLFKLFQGEQSRIGIRYDCLDK